MSVNTGWVKLYRELKSKSIWQSSTPAQKVVLITILMTANHEENEWEWKGQQCRCKAGQLITSLQSLADECGKGVNIQSVRSSLARFEKLGFLTNESTKAGRLITIINWDKYQGVNPNPTKNPTKAQQRGNKGPTNNPTKKPTPNKNIKNNKNDKNDKEVNSPADETEDHQQIESYITETGEYDTTSDAFWEALERGEIE